MWLSLLAACGDPEADPKDPVDTGVPLPTVPTLPTPPTEPLPACSPPLAVSPAGASVDPLDLFQFTASGGTGAYRWSLADGGGSVSAFGTYLAPDGAGEATVHLEDAGCDGAADATITVGRPFSVAPAAATVLPRTSFTVEVDGGSGSVACALVDDGSGASLSGCDYEAGPDAGVDRIRVEDAGTGEVAWSTVTVDPDASFRVWGEEGWSLPVDHPFVPVAVGGSGTLDLTVVAGPFDVVDGAVVANARGTGRVHVRDHFAGFEVEVVVDGLPAYVPPSTWFGTASLLGRVTSLGDVDQDGYDDAALGFPEPNTEASGAGAAVVYRGGPDGLEPEPAWTWAGTSADEGVGKALGHADVDGDGLRDLLVGTDADDYGLVNVGTVQMFRGVAGGTFDPEPFRLLRGIYSSDRMGSSLVVCDVDGDGVDDVATGAWAHESRVGTTYPSDTGALMVFRGASTPNGVEYPDAPTTLRYGAAWTLGAWTGVASSQLGLYGLAGGDVDGDGDCDLAVATPGDGVFGASDAYGFVQVFEGVPSGQGTLSALPTRQYANVTDTNANFGRDLAMDDVDGDGLADLLVGAWSWDGPRGGSAGGAFLFLGASWDGRDATVPVEPDEADWWVTGRQSSDYVGVDVGFTDIDGDGAPDVLVGVPRGETLTGVANAGVVRVYAAADILAAGPHDAIDDVPGLEVSGAVSEEFFGQAADVVGDSDGDGDLDVLVLAGRSDAEGLDVGVVYEASVSGELRRLELPGEPAGLEHGRSATFFDVDGDGDDDLIVGSAHDADLVRGTYSGDLHPFLGDGGVVFDGAETPFAGTWSDWGGSDRVGFAQVRLDFDGDGELDLAVAARNDSRPTTFGASYANPNDCPGSLSGSGSVTIWRGTPTGLATTPSFVFYGPDGSANVRVLSGGAFDHDGDGTDDLVVAGRDWRVEGGVAVVTGRPANPAGITVICAADTWYGLVSGELLGQGASALPDLDNDGCDELAVGSPREDTRRTDQGMLRVVWGYGATCASSTPRVTTLEAGLQSAGIGDVVASGDFDGDAHPDLLVTSEVWRVGNERMGGLFLVPGSYLRSLPRDAATVGVWPAAPAYSPLVPVSGHYAIAGPRRAARFGVAAAAVRDPESGRDLLAVGLPDGDLGGAAFAGGVAMYRWVADTGDGTPGIDPVPVRVVGGETASPGGALGDSLSSVRAGARGVLLVGAPLSSAGGLRLGATYVVPVERP